MTDNMKHTLLACLIVLGVCGLGVIIGTIANLIKGDEKPKTYAPSTGVYSYECPDCGFCGTYAGQKYYAKCQGCGVNLYEKLCQED